MGELSPAAVTDVGLIVHGLAGADACRKACHWLDRFGPPYRFVDLRTQRMDAATLRQWSVAMDGWTAMVDRGGRAWAALLPQRKHPQSEPEWTLLIREHPGILRQPIAVLADGRVVVGFSGGSYEKIFGKRESTS